jgi:outer membrane protein
MRAVWFLSLLLASFAQAQESAPERDIAQKRLLAHPIPSLQESKPGQAEVPTLTLEESISLAVRTATSVERAKGDLDISGEQLLQSYAQFLPNLVAIGTLNRTVGQSYYTQATPAIVQTDSRGPTYQVSSTLNLFNGLNDLASLKSSLNRREASDLSLTRAKQQIALDVAQTYLQVTLDQELVKIAKENLNSSQAREALLAEQTRVGVRNLADLFRQQAQTSSDETFLVNAESKERSDELLLLRKLRVDAGHNYRLVSPKLEEEADATLFGDEDQLVHTALEHRVDLRASESVARAASWEVTQSRSIYFPRLDFGISLGSEARELNRQIVGGIDQTNLGVPAGYNDQLAHNVQYSLGLTLTWTIFDRWLTETNVQKARVAAHNAGIDQEDRRNQVIGEIRQAFGDYRSVLQQLESTKKGLTAARKAYEVVQGRYQVGSASFVDLTTAQAALVQAEASRAQALIAFALQTRTVETALGTVKVN